MEIAAAAVIVPLGVLFFLSGLVVNFIQAVCFMLIRPFSKNTHRRVNKVVAELLWLELVWLIDWWAGVKIQLYMDSETFKLLGKEHALVMPNHRSDIDWLVGWVLAQKSGCLGSSLAVMKKSSKLLPVIGWSMWFSEYLFLERSRAKDENTLKLGFQRLRDFPQPLWLALFVEGTRFTQAKLLAAQEYATSTGLAVPRNVLIPRTKDKLLDKHIAYNSFGEQLHDTGRPLKSLVVVISWASLLTLGAYKIFQTSSLLSSWKGLTFSGIGLTIVTALMQILIQFSMSERSAPAWVNPPKPKDRESSATQQDKQQ